MHTRFLAMSVVAFLWVTLGSTPAAAADKANQPFIEQTLVIAPEIIGGFRLLETHYDAKRRFAGVMLRYATVPNPDLTVDVFVFPVGRSSQKEALEHGMPDFVRDLRQAEEAGMYRDLKIDSTTDFPLAMPASEARAAPTADEKLRAMLAGEPVIGKRMQISMLIAKDGRPVQSYGYLFHKQLNFFKVRVSYVGGARHDASFEEFADDAARRLVPAIEALNVGACGNKTIHVDKTAKPDEVLQQMLGQTTRMRMENCESKISPAELAKKSHGAKVEQIQFDPNDWK